jgi:hypothetical protein
MMGKRTAAQEALFYEFSLDRHVPADHLVRGIDRFIDLSGIRAHLRPFYSDMGRPSIDPELMIRSRRMRTGSAPPKDVTPWTGRLLARPGVQSESI